MTHFKNCFTVEEIKKRYRELAKQMHPDKGGDPEQFRQLDEQYKLLNKIAEERPQLPEYFSVNGRYSYFRASVNYIGRDNYWYRFEKPGGADILIDSNHMNLIRTEYLTII